MKGPEGAVPEDQWVACPQLRCFDLAHAEVMVAGRVRLDQAALETERCSRATATRAGSADTETRLLAVRPRNSSPARALTTTTPAGRWAMASRKACRGTWAS